jgi:hypothetical protein
MSCMYGRNPVTCRFERRLVGARLAEFGKRHFQGSSLLNIAISIPSKLRLVLGRAVHDINKILHFLTTGEDKPARCQTLKTDFTYY